MMGTSVDAFFGRGIDAAFCEVSALRAANLLEGWGPVEEAQAGWPTSAAAAPGPSTTWPGPRTGTGTACAARWGTAWQVWARDLEFDSPQAETLRACGFGPEVARVRCRLLAPGDAVAGGEEGTAWGKGSDVAFPCDWPVAFNVPQLGAEGYAWRESMFAALAADHGVVVVLLENAFFGARRPAAYRAGALTIRTAAEILLYGACSQSEGAAFLAHLHRRGLRRLAVFGASFGGCMAASIAPQLDFPVACAALLAAHSAEAVFLDSSYARTIRWARLAKHGPAPSFDYARAATLAGGSVLEDPRRTAPARDHDAEAWARAQMRAVLRVTDGRRHPPPLAPEASVIVAARGDGYIPFDSPRILHRHWGAASRLWEVPGGHVTGFVLADGVFRKAVLASLAKLEPVLARASKL